MRYKATVSFTGVVSMAVGEVKEIASPVAENLVKVGYIIPLDKAEKAEKPVEEVKEKKKSPKRKENKNEDN